MAHITHTIVQCDRCEGEFEDPEKVHKIRVEERTVPTDDLITHPTTAWARDGAGFDLCEACAEDFADYADGFV